MLPPRRAGAETNRALRRPAHRAAHSALFPQSYDPPNYDIMIFHKRRMVFVLQSLGVVGSAAMMRSGAFQSSDVAGVTFRKKVICAISSVSGARAHDALHLSREKVAHHFTK
jgi:hypothetical protein